MASEQKGQPPGWVSIALGDLAEIRLGRQRSPDKANGPHMVPYLRAANVTWGGLDLSDVKQMSFTPVEQETYRLRSDDILLSEASGSAGEVGKPAVWADEIPGCCFQNTLIRVRPPHGTTKFLYFQLLHFALSGRFIDDVKGVGIHHLGSERLSKINVQVAPLLEQHRIVAAIEEHLSDIDAGVTALERALLNLKRYRASVLKAACEGKLVPTEADLARKEGRSYETAGVLLERILKERRERWEATRKTKYKPPVPPNTAELRALPEGWVWATVETVGDVLLGRQRAPQYLTGKWTHPYLRVANIKDDRIDFDDVESMDFDPEHFEKYRLEPGDILVSEGQSPDRVGESAIYQGGIDGLCFQKTLHRFRPVPSGPPAKYAQIVFRAHVKTGVFRKMASITTNIAHLTLEKFEAAPFPLPPLAEQHRIVAEVDRLLSVADETEAAVRAQLARAERLRQAVLKRAFEGKLVPQDPSDEPASVMLERIREARTAGEMQPTRRRGARRARAESEA